MRDDFMKIYNDHMRATEFLEFMDSKCFSTYMFLRAAIIREREFVSFGKGRNTDSYRIYYIYFKKGKLVARYSMATMGEYFNKAKSVISKRIKELEKRGFIKIHKFITDTGIAYDYELGYYTGTFGTDDYKEHYYMDEYFDKLCNKK